MIYLVYRLRAWRVESNTYTRAITDASSPIYVRRMVEFSSPRLTFTFSWFELHATMGDFDAPSRYPPSPPTLSCLRSQLATASLSLRVSVAAYIYTHQVSALIHTANRDYKALIEDLVSLEVLPADTDRGQVR